jgi:anti-anti-sigma factor
MHSNESFARLSGDLDTNTVDRALEVLNAAISAATERVLAIDLADVTFADSSALRMLLDAKERAEAEGVELVLMNVPKQMHRVLEITKLDAVFDIDDTHETVPDSPSESA